jgi:hypothetical protein
MTTVEATFAEMFEGWDPPGAAEDEGWGTVGSILGSVAGGLLGGPLGAVAGGWAGRTLGSSADTPAAPATAPIGPPPPPPPTPAPQAEPAPKPPAVGAVAVPPECVAISALATTAPACPMGTQLTRPLRMPAPGIGRFESNAVIAAFAADLASCYANRMSSDPTKRAQLLNQKLDKLATDYAATLTAGLVRYGAGWKNIASAAVTKRTKELRTKRAGELTAADLAALEQTRCQQEEWLAGKMNWVRSAWMVGKREEVDFQTLTPAKQPVLSNFLPPPLAPGGKPDLVPIEPEGSGTPVTRETKAFLVELRRHTKGFDAGNYARHGSQGFVDRGYSVDLFVRISLDGRGFYPRDAAAQFLLTVADAARAVGLRWRVLYNDYAVAAHVNARLGARHVVFVGTPGKNLVWHGPLVLHFHIDLAP